MSTQETADSPAARDADQRRQRGREAFRDVMTVDPPEDSSPATDVLLEGVFAEVWTRPALRRRDRRFVTLACVADADVEQEIVEHVYAALNSGDVTITEMREAVLHFAVYAGWPKASRFDGIVDKQWERIHRERGIPVPAREPLLPLTTASDPEARLAGGEQSFRDINCLAFSPNRDNPFQGAGILNFVFGEMWLRPGLGMKERRLITLACVAFQDAPTPILSHVYAALASREVSFTEMDELIRHIAVYCGWPKASHLNHAVTEVKPRVLAEWQTEHAPTGQEQP
ncbi:carboxymuconolactone decarboxylase family protein [Nocardia alni]|uniref:carboxymuconolactone decarboxylase family protein n=1 Tax=Nocardia alni TaxID=2815723 RepID=UPI001C244115|nr:carboxymuconolactone decarboxylase family protein [Nocardia alni]